MKPEASSRFYTREKRSGKLLVGKRTECFLVGACLPSIPNGETRADLRLFSENLSLLFPGNLKTVPVIRRRVPVFCKVCAGGVPQALPSIMHPVSFCFNTLHLRCVAVRPHTANPCLYAHEYKTLLRTNAARVLYSWA